MTFDEQALELARSGRCSSADDVVRHLMRLGYGDADRRATWLFRRRIGRICREAARAAKT